MSFHVLGVRQLSCGVGSKLLIVCVAQISIKLTALSPTCVPLGSLDAF